jgi:hypothetical protein
MRRFEQVRADRYGYDPLALGELRRVQSAR